MAAKTRFSEGDKVRIKGKDGVHVVTRPMMIPVPSVVNHQFAMVDTEIYKFITKTETYYAYGSDLKPAK